MSDNFPHDAIEQTRALGKELGIPMDRIMNQVSKALGSRPAATSIDWDSEPPEGDLCEEEPPYQDDINPPKSYTESTSNDQLTGQKKRCTEHNRFGEPCGAYRRLGSKFCAFHDPEIAEEIHEARTSGGRRTVYRLPAQVDANLANINLSLHNRVGTQASMEAIMRMLLLGHIPSRHAVVLMRYFNGAIRNFQDTKGFSISDRNDYNSTLADILRTAELIERDLENKALNERMDKISDARAKREEILQANETFGYGPKPTPAPAPRSPKVGYGPNDLRPFYG